MVRQDVRLYNAILTSTYHADDTLEPSDEEVLAYSPTPSEDENDEELELSPKEHDEDSEEQEAGDLDESWGPSKQDYYSADVIETEQDAAEEEEEAMRLQRKHLKNMADTDYGFDEGEWSIEEPTGSENDPSKHVVTEVLPQFQVSDDVSFPERLKLLKGRYPEFEPLSKDLLDLQGRYHNISQEQDESHENGKSLIDGSDRSRQLHMNARGRVLQVQHQALSLYLGALSLYFAFLTSTAADNDGQPCLPLPATDLRSHEIMENLVDCRALWTKVKDMRVPEKETKDNTKEESTPTIKETHAIKTGALDAINDLNATMAKKQNENQVKKSFRSSKEVQAQAEAATRHAERMRRVEEELAELDELTSTKAPSGSRKPRSSTHRTSLDRDSDLGEEKRLTVEDFAEKAKRRKSLRFYTSQIAQKSNKRGAAGRDAGGDMDIPHRERLRDRQARLNAEAEKRGKKADDATALGGESDEEDDRQAREVRGENGDAEDYYDVIAARSKQRKQDKRDRAQAHAQATKEGGRLIETGGDTGPDMKRPVGYRIEKNTGLTPHRKKDVRNPRVKKRKKFDEKKKKLGSMKPVYRGGEGKGGYGVSSICKKYGIHPKAN